MNPRSLACVLLCSSLSMNVQALLVPLGSSHGFAVLAGSTITNTGDTWIDGDLGVAPGTAITGFFGTSENDGPGTFVGVAYQGDSVALQAQADALVAYHHLAGLAFTRNLTGLDLGGTSLAPGVYRFDSSAQLTGKLTLDGAGLYVFQIGSTLTTATASSIEALNGANPSSQVFWQIGSSATFGADTLFGGTVIALASNTLGARSTVDGRVMALTGGVTLDNNQIVVPEVSTVWMLALAGLAVVSCRYLHGHVRLGTTSV